MRLCVFSSRCFCIYFIIECVWSVFMTANKKPEIKNNNADADNDLKKKMKSKVQSKSVSCRVYVYLCVQCNALTSSFLMRTTSTANPKQINLCARTHKHAAADNRNRSVTVCHRSHRRRRRLHRLCRLCRIGFVIVKFCWAKTHKKKVTIEKDQRIICSYATLSGAISPLEIHLK